MTRVLPGMVFLLGAALAQISAATAQPAGPAGPLSAIDWLRAAEGAPQPGAYPVTPPTTAEPGTGISVRALDALRPEAVGLYPAARVGLPAGLWGATPAGELARLIADLPVDTLPVMRELALRLLLAEFDAPLPSADAAPGASPDFLLARIDKLTEFGALDQAGALLDALDSADPVLRRRRFDIGLLLGDEDTSCAVILRPEPPINDAAALVFCQARAGEWLSADNTLADATARGALGPYEAAMLAHFLHGEDALPDEALYLPPLPGATSALMFRVLEANGEPTQTLTLPVAFAHADLRGTVGWRAQIEAAERLVRAGALPPNRLLGLYTERRAAASGGIWERVRLVQRLDDALHAGDAAASGAALMAAWPQFVSGELEVALASLYAQPLGQMALEPAPRAIAFRLGLLSDGYETVALGIDPAQADAQTLFLAAVARGLDPLAAGGAMPGELARAVALAFGPEPSLPEGLAERLAQDHLGAEILAVLIRLGGPGDPRALAEGLAVLRVIGLEDVARRAALQGLLLDRRG